MKSVLMVAALLTAAITAGCGDENGGVDPGPRDLVLADLVGTWTATTLEVTKDSDPSKRVDLIARGGAVIASFQSNRRVALVATLEGETEAHTGSLRIEGHDIVVTGDVGQESRRFACERSEYAMSLTNAYETYDFDGDGVEEGASLLIEFARAVNEFSVAEFAGTWQAKTWEFTNDADPLETVDLIALGGGVTATLESNARYTMQFTNLDGSTETEAGRLHIVGPYIVPLNDGHIGDPDAFLCELSGDIMTLVANSATYDFDADGVEEDALLTVLWERQ